MDILKELFGTSDELQISKSLFGSDAPSTSVELGLGERGRTEGGDVALSTFAVCTLPR